MNIEIQDATLEARMYTQMQATGTASAEEVLMRLLNTQEEQDRWLLESKSAIEDKIQRGLAELDRGEGIADSDLAGVLARLKAEG